MNKQSKAIKLAEILFAAARKTPEQQLDRNWEDQVMEHIALTPSTFVKAHEQKSDLLKASLPSLSSFGALAASLTLIAYYKLDAIDAHLLKATVDSAFHISTRLFPL